MNNDENKKEVQKKAVLIYDAACPVCSRTIVWIQQNAQEESFEMMDCRSEIMKKRFPNVLEAECMQAMQLVLPGGTVLPGEKALPEIFRRLKRYRRVEAIFKVPGSERIFHVFYRWFAGHRYHIAKFLFPGKEEKNDKAA